ncbi:MAG: LysM peptidoglycan-binding domain-containing protein [Caldilinea sp.]
MAQQAPTPDAPRLPANSPTSGELRSAATRPCPTCGAPASINASICPTCGDSLPSRNKQIRCRRCGGKASAVLVVCPHCGRELQPAPPRLLTWGAPLVLVAFFGAVLFAQMGGASPLAWSQRQIERVATFVGNIGDQLQLDLSITTEPLEENFIERSSQPSQPQEVADADGVTDALALSENEGVENSEPSLDAEATPEPAEESAPLPTEAPTEAPTETPVDTPTSAPTSTEASPTETPTEAPSSTPISTPTVRASGGVTPSVVTANTASITATTPTTPEVQAALALPTPTPPAPTATPKIHRIRAGDTLFEIALANDVSLAALLAANGLTEDDVYTIQPGDEIIIPDPNATIEPPATATPTPAPTRDSITHTVQPGDTLMAIGLRYGVNLQRILDANGMTLAQARTLRPGQELIIPGDAPLTSTPTNTPTPQPTLAITIPTATPTSAARTSATRLDPPTLRAPENRVSVKCGAGEQLVWNAVPFIQPTDVYVVHLGYVNGRDANGVDQIVWVIAQQRPSNVTLWQLDDALCGLAPLEYGREWRWYVDVAERSADGTLTSVSLASELWSFTWQ